MARSADDVEPFTLAAGAVAVLGCLLMIASPFFGATPSAFRGSATATGLVGLVFAGQNLRIMRAVGRPRLAPATMTAAFGIVFALTPLLYADVGFAPTAGVQFAGVLAGGFGGYAALEAIETRHERRDRP